MVNFQNNGIFGFDVSFYQRIPATSTHPAKEIDFYRVKNYGARFVIIKAGQGNYKDPGFDYNWKAAKLAGIPRASYFFEDKDFSPQSQAEFYWNLIKDDPGEGFCAMDFETGSHSDLNSAYVFLNRLQQLSMLPDNKIAIYTGYPFWNAALNNADRSWFRRFPLWQAWYSDDPADVLNPYPWNELLTWQDGTPSIGLNVGVQSKEIDHNIFNGGEEKFKLYFGETIGGEPMPETNWVGKVKAEVTLGATVRDAPAGASIGQKLAANTAIEGTGVLVTAVLNGISYNWMNIIKPVSGWVADSLLDYTQVSVPITTHKLEVFVDGVLEFTKEF